MAFRIAAAFSAKNARLSLRNFAAFDPATAPVVYPSLRGPRSASGQDSFFVASLGADVEQQQGEEEEEEAREDMERDESDEEGVGHEHDHTFKKSEASKTQDLVFGVADGVGGWDDMGIDSADFSHGLCARMAAVAATRNEERDGRLGAEEMLQRAYDMVLDEGQVLGGGSTACVAVARGREAIVEVAK